MLVDFASVDGDIEAMMEGAKLPYHIIRIDSDFSRSIGLSKGLQWLSILGVAKEAKVFVVDASIVLPEDIVQRVRNWVHFGHSVYAPIVKKVPCQADSLLKPPTPNEGVWAWAAYGMIGFSYGDYISTGGYNTAWGYHWGAEDVDLINTFREKGYWIIRKTEEQYFHYNCFRDNTKAYYKNKNFFDKHLPVIPEARPVSEPIQKSIEEWVYAEEGMRALQPILFAYGNSESIGYYFVVAEQRDSNYLLTIKATSATLTKANRL